MNLKAKTENIATGIRRYRIAQDNRSLSFADIAEGWQKPDFADFFTDMMATSPFEACFWEMPPLTTGALDNAFECVLIDSSSLARVPADPCAFADHFAGEEEVTTFHNLGGDALLVVPCPGTSQDAYPHLLAFCRHAPGSQQRALWCAVAKALDKRLGDKPVWLSTSGLGVYWLHIRLDNQPKYYQYQPYTRIDYL